MSGGDPSDDTTIGRTRDAQERRAGMAASHQPRPRLGLDPVLLEVLACPADHHAPLMLGSPSDPEADALTCSDCGRVFPIRDGIPVLLLDEATGGPGGTR